MKRTQLKSYTRLKAKKSLGRGKSTLKRSWMKKPPMTEKRILDMIVSETVRRTYADKEGYVKCSTCSTVKHWKYMQCGHFQRRGHMATRFDFRNLAPQCEECNEHYDGRPKEFAIFIDEVHGPGTATYLKQQAQAIVHDFNYEQEQIKWEGLLSLLVEANLSIEY